MHLQFSKAITDVYNNIGAKIAFKIMEINLKHINTVCITLCGI